MVATIPHYRTQSDPDGVIHVSDDDVDFNEQSDYGYAKGSGNTANFVDVSHIVDPPDVREQERLVDRRDPPTDPGSPIYDVKSMTSNGQLSDIVEESPDRTAQGLSPPPLGRDPSLRSNPSLVRSNPSMTKSNPSIVKSSSSLVKSNSNKSFSSPVRSMGSHAQEIITVESIDIDRGLATSPIAPSVAHSGANMKRENWPYSMPMPAQNAKMEKTSAETRTEEPIHVVEEEPFEPGPTSPDAPEDGPMEKTGEPREAIGILPDDNAATTAANETRDPAESGSVLVETIENEDVTGNVPPATQANESEANEGGWIFSGFMNTLTCRGPEPVSSSSGPLGLVTCGPTNAKQEDVFAQDDDENSVLGPKGFGDLASLPSLEDSIIHNTGDNDTDNESLSSRVSRSSMQTECLGNAVESKIKNLEMEKQIEAETKDDHTESEFDMTTDDPEVQRLTLELKEAVKSFGQHHVRCAHVSSALAEKYTEKKAFKKALELQRKVVSTFSAKLGDHHKDTLDAKVRLGKCLEDAEEYDLGISTFYEVMAMRRSLEGEKDPSTSDALILIANCLRKKGQYMQAIRELKRALKVYRESLGDSHPSVASTVDEIASLYVTLGDFEKSAAILEEVVKLKAATLGMQNKQVASSLVELATSYECSEDFDRAVKALKKAYKIFTDLDGFSCEEATSTLHRIALIYQASGDIHKAAIAYLGVLRGKKHLLGDDHLEVAETYYRLGVCLRETNQLDKALKCMKEALPILVGKGKNIHDVDMIAEVMHEMALLYKAKRQLTEAAKIFKQELTVRRKIGQPDYPCIAKTLNHLGVTEYEMKMHRRALKHLLEVLTIFQERQEQGIDFAEALYNIGLVFEAVRNKDRAYEAFLEAARVFKANGYANDHPHMTKAVNKVKRLASRK